MAFGKEDVSRQQERMSWALQLEEPSMRSNQARMENISNFIVILPCMKQNYKLYPDLIFVDTSMKHKIPVSMN
jgi:hypothetical protein